MGGGECQNTLCVIGIYSSEDKPAINHDSGIKNKNTNKLHKWWFAGEDKQQEVFNAALKGLKTMSCSDHPYVILTVLWIERVCVVYSHFNATTVHQCLYGNIFEGLDVSRLVRVIPLLLQWKLNQTESRLWSVSCMSWLSHSAAQRALREKKPHWNREIWVWDYVITE